MTDSSRTKRFREKYRFTGTVRLIEARDKALALADLERLGTEIQVLTIDDLHKLREILSRSKERLNVQGYREEDMIW